MPKQYYIIDNMQLCEVHKADVSLYNIHSKAVRLVP